MTKMFGQNFPRPIPKKPKPQNPEFNSIPIPPPKRWIPPPFWGGIYCFGGGIRFPPQIGGGIGMELNSGFWDFSFFGIGLGTF